MVVKTPGKTRNKSIVKSSEKISKKSNDKKVDGFSLRQILFIFRNSNLAKPPRNANFVLLTAIISVLCIIGAVMVLSASSVAAIANYGSAWFFFQRQVIWLILGAVAFLVMSRIPYTFWQRMTKPIVFSSIFLLILVLIPGIGIEAYGSKRWLNYFSYSFN